MLEPIAIIKTKIIATQMYQVGIGFGTMNIYRN
jgi:hypothetical protein